MEHEYVFTVIKVECIGLWEPLVNSKAFKNRKDAIEFMEDDFKKKLNELKMCETTHILDINEYNALQEKNIKYFKGYEQDSYNTYKTRWVMDVNKLN